MGWTYAEETCNEHHQTGTEMEPARTKEKRSTQKYMEKRFGNRSQTIKPIVGSTGKDCPGEREVESACW